VGGIRVISASPSAGTEPPGSSLAKDFYPVPLVNANLPQVRDSLAKRAAVLEHGFELRSPRRVEADPDTEFQRGRGCCRRTKAPRDQRGACSLLAAVQGYGDSC
jgi:hypothetical protein